VTVLLAMREIFWQHLEDNLMEFVVNAVKIVYNVQMALTVILVFKIIMQMVIVINAKIKIAKLAIL
jgi:hypothetical protein